MCVVMKITHSVLKPFNIYIIDVSFIPQMHIIIRNNSYYLSAFSFFYFGMKTTGRHRKQISLGLNMIILQIPKSCLDQLTPASQSRHHN